MRLLPLVLVSVLLSAGCGNSSNPGSSTGAGGGGTFDFTVNGVAEAFSPTSGNSTIVGIHEQTSSAESGSPLNITLIGACDTSACASVMTLQIPVWPLVVGTWTCPTDWEAGIIYQPSGAQYYAGQNGQVNPNAATAPCSIAITQVGSAVKGTFSGTVGDANGTNLTVANGTFSIPGS